MPRNSAILQSSIEVDYDFVAVAGQSYTNVATFEDYRKFEVDSSVDFGPGKR
jgi:hypothetical protein